MRFSWIVGPLLAAKILFADTGTWTIGEQLSLVNSNQSYNSYVTVASVNLPGPGNGTAMAAWVNSDFFPYYSIYQDGVWSPGQPITTLTEADSEADYGITLCFDSTTSNVFAAWNHNGGPYYSIYSSGSWSTPMEVPSTIGVTQNVTLTSYASGNVLAAGVPYGTYQPWYTIYENGSWGTPGTISSTTSGGNVSLTTDSAGNVFAVWGGELPYIYYSIYNGSWNPAERLPTASVSYVPGSISLTSDASGKVFAAWVSFATPYELYYSIYNGEWSTPASIPSPTLAELPFNFVNLTYNQNTDQVFATWSHNTDPSNPIYYAIYSNSDGTWSIPGTIPLGASNGPRASSYGYVGGLAQNYGTDEIIATWPSNSEVSFPYFSSYPAIVSPTNGVGRKITNRFVFETEWYNQLNWAASISSGVVGYNVRRDGELIASRVTQDSYKDHDRPKNGSDTYAITSINAQGQESSNPLIITVQ